MGATAELLTESRSWSAPTFTDSLTSDSIAMMNQLAAAFLLVLIAMQVQGQEVGNVGPETKNEVANSIPADESLAIPIKIVPTGNAPPHVPGQQIIVESGAPPVDQPSVCDPLMNVHGMKKDGQLTGGDGFWPLVVYLFLSLVLLALYRWVMSGFRCSKMSRKKTEETDNTFLHSFERVQRRVPDPLPIGKH